MDVKDSSSGVVECDTTEGLWEESDGDSVLLKIPGDIEGDREGDGRRGEVSKSTERVTSDVLSGARALGRTRVERERERVVGDTEAVGGADGADDVKVDGGSASTGSSDGLRGSDRDDDVGDLLDVEVLVEDGRVSAVVSGSVGAVEGPLEEVASRAGDEARDVRDEGLFEFKVSDVELVLDDNRDGALANIVGSVGSGGGDVGVAREKSLLDGGGLAKDRGASVLGVEDGSCSCRVSTRIGGSPDAFGRVLSEAASLKDGGSGAGDDGVGVARVCGSGC